MLREDADFGSFITIVVLIVVYFVPLMIAVRRDMVKVNGVAVLNLLLGWTLLGWIVALVWAVAGDRKQA